MSKSVPENYRDAVFQAKQMELAIKRGDTAMVAKLTFNIKHGDLVQMSRLGISRQNKSGMFPKDETSKGVFVRERAYLYGKPKHPAAIVRWYHVKDGEEVEREQETRIDYLEPLGTPR